MNRGRRASPVMASRDRAPGVRHRTLWWTVAGVSAAVWVWSWTTMWLEVFRWKHVTRTLRFNPGPPIPGTDIRPKPGRPLLFLYLCCALAPAVFAVAWVLIGRTSRPR